jgi:hypothetical protein
VFLTIVTFGIAACSGSPPEILFVDRSLNIVEDGSNENGRESLRVFVAVRDPDGPQDIERISVAHEESELVWYLDPESWSTLSYGGDEWYGHPRLQHPQGEALPRGRFSVIAQDRAGGASETEFFLTSPISAEAPSFPELVQGDGELQVVFETPVIVRGYSAAGELVFSRVVAPGLLSDAVIEELRASGADHFYLFSDVSDRRLASRRFALDPP